MKENRVNLVLDTNVFVRIFVGDIKSQMVECFELFEFLSANKKNIKIYIPQVVFLELGWVLGGGYYKFSRKKIKQALLSLKSDNFSLTSKVNFDKSLKFFGDYGIKLGDAMIAASDIIQKDKAIIVSYDKDFDKIDGVIKMTPAEVLKKFK